MGNIFTKKYTAKNNEPIVIQIDHDRPFFRISKAILNSFANKWKSINFKISMYFVSENKEELIQTFETTVSSHTIDITHHFNNTICNEKYFEQFKIHVSGKSDQLKLELEIENFAIDIPTAVLFKDFKSHLDLKNNTRILFTAPFGKGKTTFLKSFFEEYTSQYEVYHVYPVNYSVASNHDIFKYIKAELLLQLLCRKNNFQEFEFNQYETLAYYLNSMDIKEFLDSCLPMVKCIPFIGQSYGTIIEPLIGLYNSIHLKQKQSKIKEKEEALTFLKSLSQKEGSIYEDNLYTQLIRALVKHFRKGTKKKSVFIIDDLDRLDPEHIFRIFNILSAHFDNPHYLTDGDYNKFGFDKIILTCDYNNIYNIYRHKYGDKTDFKGYINKYYSIAPYKFENEHLLKKELDKLFVNFGDQRIMQILKNIIYLLIDKNVFNARDLIAFQKQQVVTENYYYNIIAKSQNNQFAFFILIHYLLKIYINRETLKSNILKISEISDNSSNTQFADLKRITNNYGLAYMQNKGSHISTKYNYSYRNVDYVFTLALKNNDFSILDFMTIGDVDLKNKEEDVTRTYQFNFELSECFQLLLVNIDEYFKHGGINENREK